MVGKHARHRHQVAHIAVNHPKQADDRGLVRGDAVEIAHFGQPVWTASPALTRLDRQVSQLPHVIALPLDRRLNLGTDLENLLLGFAPSPRLVRGYRNSLTNDEQIASFV